MKKRLMTWALVLALLMTAAVPALAANVFMFTERAINIYEGETFRLNLRREGNYEGDGQIEYASGKASVATVSPDGVITAVSKGKTEVSASLIRNGKRVGKAVATVNVLRAVTRVTLNTTKLSVYNADDPAVISLLQEPTDHRVIVLPAGSTAALSATCTPEDASDKKVTFTTSDAGVAKVTGTSLKAIQRGECDLTVSAVQNPQIKETYRLLVIQPVKSIQINAGQKKVAAGSTLQLTAACQPGNASIPQVTWSSKAPAIAFVDEYGVVTGLKRGSATITATAADGSRATATVTISVTQPVTGISVTTPEVQVVAGKTATAKASVQPSDATDKTLSWTTSDPSIATVRGNGQVVGVKAGTCTITATSNSNPEISASATVVVSQLVTKIENANRPDELTLRVGESVQTLWNILPADATVTALSFKSNAPKVATVDENGVIRAQGRGVVTIVAASKDAGRRQGTVKVTVIQPVTGVSMQRGLYYIQRGNGGTIRAVVQPKNANNQKVYWSSMDEGIATIRSNGTNTGYVYGLNSGSTMVTAYTEDGGFSASAEIRVGNWNSVVLTEELFVDANNKIRITMRNMSQELTLTNIHFIVECYDTEGNPMICNTDGESTSFEADYPYLLAPYDRTIHGSFNFRNYMIDRELGTVVLTVVSWRDVDGNQYVIPESERVRTQWTRYNYYNPNQGEGVG